MLSVVLFLPLIGAIALYAVDKTKEKLVKFVAFGITVATFVLSVPLYFAYDAQAPELFQLGQRAAWIPSFGIDYFVAVDGISLLMVLLVTFLMPIVVLGSVGAIKDRFRDFYALMLVLESFMIGAFIARDLFLFYVCWELMVVPMFLIIAMWGGPPRVYAAMKFFLYTLFGSLPMLLAVLHLYVRMRHQAEIDGSTATYSLDALANLDLTAREQWWCFLAFGLSFAVKVPMFPFHTWLPDAHTEAPTPGSMVLAGVLLKMGGYGFLRFALPMFPLAVERAAPWIFVLGAFGIVYAALVALIQRDVKRLIAYSSVSHMGLIVLGIFTFNADGIRGSVYQMLSHGVTTGGLFLLVGMLYERRHTRMFSEFGGIAKRMPVFCFFFVAVTLGSVGMPGTNGFVGEFMILRGVFAASPLTAIVAVTGVVLGAWYMLATVRKIFFGPIDNPANEELRDLDGREMAALAPLVVLIVVMGLRAEPFMEKMQPSVDGIITSYEAGLEGGR